MKEVLLSDWTLAAFMQREEERRRKEQTEAPVAPLQKQTQRSAEPLRSDLTIAALQKRFVALEQRIETLEQMVGERRRKEPAEAPAVAPRAETPRSEPTPVEPVLVAQTARVAAARMEDLRVEAPAFASEQRLKRSEPEPLKADARGSMARDSIDFRPPQAPHVEPSHKKAGGLTSFMITALTAATIGFGAAIYEVPVEKAVEFRSLAKRGLDTIYEGLSSSVKQ
ncbi:hypothetical protein [Methylocystis parvus]|uniref:hypothetical protein n=1 Tax=Methylocystis parvus TaxID=134 RepID=UPI003C7127AC